eukprot:CAMPEP_0181054154 /NCGR_PEP_ID=MMETSP1070-20121207/18526_1 /TAXON_ID=265543 /ORGANISM="Minutocellus polymorphus, Strain NH13" /LENGTH=676 /DNA_ID=CAMNT_0023133403 /DNA_START=21 /DNA_END=2051 /DNA_ORIENTATION=-
MASNPFDDFAQDFGASLPGQQQQAGAFGGLPASAGGAAAPVGTPFPTASGVMQHQPPIGAMSQPQQLGQVPVPQQYPGQQPPGAAPGVMSMNGTVAAPPHQQQQQPAPPSHPSVIGVNSSATGMYYQQPPTQQAQPQQPVPTQPSSSALVPSAVDAAAPSPYASMLGPSPMGQHPPVQQQPNVAPMGMRNSLGSGTPAPAPATGGNPFQAPHPAVAATSTPVIDASNPFAAPLAPGAPLMQSHAVGGTNHPPSLQDSAISGAGMPPPSAPGPYGVPAAPAAGPGQFDPISMSAVPPAPPADPFGASSSQPPLGASAGALVPASQPADDPFGVFAAPVAAVPTAAPAASAISVSTAAPPPSSDPWADMGFGPPVPDSSNAAGEPATSAAGALQGDASQGMGGTKSSNRTPGELPPGGEWYDARIFTPTLGVMFFKPQELTDSLFLQTDKALVDALDDRPVVAFIVEGSSARSAGVELGHVLLKVNGIDVKNPKEASRLIKEGPRPLPLLFYVPDTTVVVAEGEHMVKYDTRETGAPNSAKDWKPKYVVIGGIIAQPWMMNMYRSKSEYDIAVIETQARRPVSVKVKQFSLQGARIQNDWQGPQMVKYKNKLHPWKYIVVLPVSRNPIKISSPNLSQLKPVHEGIRRVLMAQQRDRGHPSPHTAAPVRTADPYSRNGH